MNPGLDAGDRAALRAWLRNERRLGIGHLAVSPQVVLAASAAAAAVSPTSPPARDAARLPRHAVLAESNAPPPARAPAPLRPRPSATPPLNLPAILDDGLPAVCTQELREPDAAAALRQLDEGFVRGCTRCPLHAQGRTKTVFGVGRARPELVFVGEGPGADEDRVGEPFVGKAGQLLTRMIGAMTLTRDQVYICNTVKCRPPENRTPTEDEMDACSPYLIRQLAILRPRVIVALGRPAAQTLLDTKTPIGQLRGRFHDFPPARWAHHGLRACKLMPTFHPAYLLRSPEEKGKAWDDLKQVMGLLGIPVPG